MPSIFNGKVWNPEVFGRYVDTVPHIKQNAFLDAGVFRNRPDFNTMLVDQTGGNIITVPMVGRIGGDVQNYDGSTDITTTGIGSFYQTMIVVGRAKAWSEKDFTYDITGHNFMENIAQQVSDYWDDIDQATVLAILSGIFGVTDGNFSTNHTLDITSESNPNVGVDTLNNAIQKAAGANKGIFTMAIMHSEVATHLENLELLEYRKGTDSTGIQRQIALADWNGRTVLIDDDVPVTAATGEGATGNIYTTYLLGRNAFDTCNCGAKVPYETDRNPYEDGGIDSLITRQRKLFAPYGFSFIQPSTPIISPTDAQLATAARWGLVRDTSETPVYFDTRSIPIARILSKG